MLSIHGICFDNGQSGRCGFECEQFLSGDCDATDDVLEGTQGTEDYINLLIEAMGELQYQVYKQQDHIELDEIKIIKDYLGNV